MRQERRVLGLAALGEDAGLLEQRLLLSGVVRRLVGAHEGVELTVGDAVEGRGLTDAPRVEADDVEVAAHLAADDAVRSGRVAHAGGAGPAGIDDEGPDATILIGGRDP